jgi:hypothetical protein
MNVNVRMTMFVFSHKPGSLMIDIIVGWRGQLTHYGWNIGQNILFEPFIDLSNFSYYEYLLGYGLIGVWLLSYFEVFANRMSICRALV